MFESPHTYNGADEEVIELRMPQARGVVLEVRAACTHYTDHLIAVQGDILVKLMHRSLRTGKLKCVWRCQFHTTFVPGTTLELHKKELDDAARVCFAIMLFA